MGKKYPYTAKGIKASKAATTKDMPKKKKKGKSLLGRY